MKSIRRRLTVGLLLGFSVLLGLGGALIYVMARHELYHEFDNRLVLHLQALAAFTKPGRDKVEFEFPQKVRPLEGASNVVTYYQLFDAHGHSLVRSPALGEADLPRRLGSLAQPAAWNLTLPDGTPGRALGAGFIARVPPKEKKPPSPDEALQADHKSEKKESKPPPAPVEVGLVVAEDRSHLSDMLNALALLLFTAGSLTLAAAAGLIAVMLRYCMVPLQALARQAERIDATSLESRFPAQDMPVELAPIVHRLNDLLARLENSFERERRFSADLAHELRTPIAGLRTTAEVALKYPEAPDPESFRSVLEIAQQMEAMVTRLLAQARSEQKAVPLQLQAVAVARLVEEVWHPLQKQAAARRLVTSFDIPPGAHIETDPTLLRGILLNLLANAVDYTPPGGTVRCAFRRRNGHFTLSVTNTVDNLEPADLPRLFERFWRKDTARSDAGHAGLGLSLAQSFAELLGLDLRAELNGGTELRLQLEGRKSSHGDPGPPSSRA